MKQAQTVYIPEMSRVSASAPFWHAELKAGFLGLRSFTSCPNQQKRWER